MGLRVAESMQGTGGTMIESRLILGVLGLTPFQPSHEFRPGCHKTTACTPIPPLYAAWKTNTPWCREPDSSVAHARRQARGV